MTIPPPGLRWRRWTLPPAAFAAIAVFAAHDTDPVAGVEGAYLARLVCAVLLGVAALAPPAAAELGLGAVLATAAAWALPAGPGRGAAVMGVLAAALAVATARRLRHVGLGNGQADQLNRVGASGNLDGTTGGAFWSSTRGGLGGGARGGLGASTGGRIGPGARGSAYGSSLAVAIALCFGWQMMLRGELLFAPGRAARPWMALLVLPVVAGAALAVLWRRHGTVPALAAATAATVLAPGWTVGTTLALVALAAGSRLAAPRQPGRFSTSPPVLRLAAILGALALPVAWEPRSGWVAAVAGVALWRPGMAVGLALPLAAVTRFAPLPGAFTAHASWREGVLSVAWLAMLAPAAWLAARSTRGRGLLAAAAVLAFAAPWLPDRTALAAPVALAALALPAAGVTAGLAAAWSGAVLLGTALLASYPWLRQDPLAEALGLLGAAAGPRLAAAVAGTALLLAAVIGYALRWRSERPATQRPPAPEGPALAASRQPETTWGAAPLAAWAAGAAILAALAAPQLARQGVALLTAGSTVLLDSANASWHREIGPWPAGSVVIESSMVHAADLAAGTPVAHVRLLSTGHPDVELVVRAGSDTGEWAALRPDVAGAARRREPRRWLAWVAGDFFGQRYRTRLLLPHPGTFARLQIDFAAGLPPDAGLALYQVELVP